MNSLANVADHVGPILGRDPLWVNSHKGPLNLHILCGCLWEAWLYGYHKFLLLWPFVWNSKLCTISSFLFLFILACHCVTLSLPECLIGFCKVTLTFESVDEILWCHHSNESSLPVLSHNAICFKKFHKVKCGHLVEICFWLNLAVKGLRKQNGLVC